MAQSQVTAMRKLRRKKIARVREYRESVGCEVCGLNHPAILDLHHKNPEDKHHMLKAQPSVRGNRKGSSGRGWAYLSFADIEAELRKCVVLCSNCHRISEWHDKRSTA